MAVPVERDGYRGVAHEARERLRVDPGGDHQAGVSVAAFVQADRPQVRSLPGRSGPVPDGRVRYGPPAVLAEDEPAAATRPHLMLEQEAPERRANRDRPMAGAALGLDELRRCLVIAAADLNHAAVELDIRPAERDQLAEAEPGVKGGGPERAVLVWQGGQEGGAFGW